MVRQIEKSIVRIWCPDDKQVAGAGFLVADKQVITCAHVITRALGLLDDPLEMPMAEVHLDFPLVAAGRSLTATAFLWRPPRGEGECDIAGLALQAERPYETEPASILFEDDLQEHPFEAFGFRTGYLEGVWSTGVLGGRAGADRVQMEGLSHPGLFVEAGFSGAPVWDQKLEGVVGMIVALEALSGRRSAFMMPGYELRRRWPELALAPKPAEDWAGFIRAFWPRFYHLEDALVILEPEAREVMASLEVGLSSASNFPSGPSNAEDWVSFMDSITDFCQYCESAQENRQVIQALSQSVTEFVKKLSANLPRGQYPAYVQKELQDLVVQLECH